MVDLTLDSRLGKNLGGLLEGCCGKEGFGEKRSLRNSEEHGRRGCGEKVSFARVDTRLNSLVLGKELGQVDRRAGEKLSASGILDLDLSGHLTCDYLDVLIVDIDAL